MDNVLHFNDWKNSYIPNILKEIYLDQVYAPYLQSIKGNVVLDLGANIGLWSLYAAPLAAQVYAFEPAKETWRIAQKNLKDNGIKNVKLYQKAVADTDGRMSFYHNENTTMNSLNERVNNKPSLKEQVETIRLDTLVKDEGIERIGFAKIDVEGTEDILFMSEGFQKIVPILDSFVYEYHSWCNAPAQNINQALQDYGYKIRQIPSEATIFGAVKV